MNGFNTLEITIQRKLGDYYPTVSKYSQSNETLPARKEGKLYLTNDDLDKLNAINKHDNDRKKLKEYGEYLGKLLFKDDIDSAFTTAYSKNENLRVLLFIEAEDNELKNLRWERLCAPMDGEWRFLRRDQRAFYSLYIPSSIDRRFPPIGRQDLRALVLVASPEDSSGWGLDKFDVQRTVDSIRTTLGKTIPCDVLAYQVDGAVGLPTKDNFIEQLTKQSYTFLHFVCHGSHRGDDNETILYWTDDKNKCKPWEGSKLIEELKPMRRLPHFAFLCTCESAKTSEKGAFGGFAGELVRDLGMPAVVAMTEKITIKTAEKLIKSFYEQLREHGWVDRALDEATAAVSNRDDVLIPALFGRLGGRPLFSDTIDRPLIPTEIENPESFSKGTWKTGQHYNVEDTVFYEGITYKCRQAHSSYSRDWIPPQTPALWVVLTT